MKGKPPLIGLRLSTLVKSIDPTGMYSLEPEAEEQLLALANDFANSLIKKSMRVAQHRNAVAGSKINGGMKRKRVEAQDVAIVLRKNYGITIPGLSGNQSTASNKVSLKAAKLLGASSAGSK